MKILHKGSQGPTKVFFIKTSKWEKWWSCWLRMINAFILCNLLWKVQKRLAANRERSFQISMYTWLEAILSSSNRMPTMGCSKKCSHVYFLMIVAMVLLLWHQIILLWNRVTMVASEQHLYQTIVQFDKRIVWPRKLETGGIHDYSFLVLSPCGYSIWGTENSCIFQYFENNNYSLQTVHYVYWWYNSKAHSGTSPESAWMCPTIKRSPNFIQKVKLPYFLWAARTCLKYR